MSDYKQFLDALKTALSVVSSVTSLPGVDLIPYVATIGKVVGYAQYALSVGEKLKPYAEALADTFKEGGGLPPQAELDALNAKIEANHKRIQDFNPVPEPGEEV